MPRRLSAVTLATLGLLHLVACGRSNAAPAAPPEAALTNEVAGVMVVDFEAMTPEALAKTFAALEDAVFASLPPEMVAQLKPAGQPLSTQSQQTVDSFTKFHEAFIKNGGRTMTMGMIPPANEGGEPNAFALVGVQNGTDPAALKKAVEDATEDPSPGELKAYRPNWLTVSGGDLGEAPTTGDAASAAKLNAALGNSSGAIRMAFRMNESAKAALEAAKQNPQAMMMAGLIDPMMHLEHGSVGITLGAAPTLAAKLTFDTPEQAQQFNTVYAGLMMMGQGMLKQQVVQMKAQMPQAPDPAVVDAALGKLAMTQAGNTLSMTLDKTFVAEAGKFAPMALPMMMMMGGGFGPPMQE